MRMKVLIAEDDPITCRLLKAKLRRWGHEVVVARDGIEAWQVLERADSPPLAILDWMMPGIDGVEICREVRKRTEGPYTYLLLLTARGQQEDIIAGIEAGADDYLIKPFDAQELRARLHAGQRVLDLEARLIAAQEALREQATRDAMTGLWNRSAILDILRAEIARAERVGTPASVILADLDHFKRINDTYGHQAGDAVLREVAQRMNAAVREYDMIGRYGGEEFLIVLPLCEMSEAVNIAERLRHCVSAEALPLESERLFVTVSLGLAPGGGPLMDADSLIKAADIALYRAKSGGRNRHEVGGPAVLL
jgi:diguanylate cyclase (GGDEF)-like protein